MADERPLVAVIMGSASDWETMRHADEVLNDFGISHECRVVSAHRTPAFMAEYASAAEGRGIQVIIAAAANAALLAVAILSNHEPALRERLRAWRAEQDRKVREAALP
jgi:phosphoribosylcarboxyaminoimidazole (NCAIR) mutase